MNAETELTLARKQIQAARAALDLAEQHLRAFELSGKVAETYQEPSPAPGPAELTAQHEVTATAINLMAALGVQEPAKVELPKVEVVKPEPIKVEEPLTINAEWQQTLDILSNGPTGVFVTGPAGSGKSTLLNHFIETYRGNAAMVGPTGVSALRIGGETIHRFLGLPAHALEPDDIPNVPDSRRAKYENLDMLIIDEISMVRADLMDAVDHFFRKNGRAKGKPFGGCRIVMFGDPYQLPPVAKEKEEKAWLNQRYGTDTPYFFHAECWRENPIKVCNLTTIFRQKDPAFTDVLNAIRAGVVKPEQLALLNNRTQFGFRPPVDDDLWITLTTTNDSADQANQRMLNALPGSPEVFEAVVTGDFDEKNFPTDQALRLKVGATVMFIRNGVEKGSWVNGTMGKVTSVNPLKVLVNGSERAVEPISWKNMTYEFDEKTKKLTKREKGEFKQIPLKLAAAITIHKSQGMTYDKVIIDLANGTFAAGQLYVAVSRGRTLEGMVLRRAIQERDLIVSTEVQKFMKGEAIARPGVPVGTLL